MFVKILFDYCFVRFVDDVLSFCSVCNCLLDDMIFVDCWGYEMK